MDAVRKPQGLQDLQCPDNLGNQLYFSLFLFVSFVIAKKKEKKKNTKLLY